MSSVYSTPPCPRKMSDVKPIHNPFPYFWWEPYNHCSAQPCSSFRCHIGVKGSSIFLVWIPPASAQTKKDGSGWECTKKLTVHLSAHTAHGFQVMDHNIVFSLRSVQNSMLQICESKFFTFSYLINVLCPMFNPIQNQEVVSEWLIHIYFEPV